VTAYPRLTLATLGWLLAACSSPNAPATCAPTPSEAPDGVPCFFTAPARFTATSPAECGLTPPGSPPSSCYWSLGTLEGQWSADSGLLGWEGMTYAQDCP